MSNVTYPVDAGSLAPGACPSTYQELADLLASIYSVTVNTNNTGIVVSATKPADTTVVWKQLDASTLRPIRDYVFVGGLWLSRHTVESGIITLWAGSIANLWSFDGGDGTDPGTSPPTPISGAMWEEVAELKAKIPIGVGTLPSGTVLALGATGGAESVNLPAHTHLVGRFSDDAQDDPFFILGSGTNASTLKGCFGNLNADNRQPFSSLTGSVMQTDVVNSATPIPQATMPPYYSLYFIRRTARQYFVVP